MIMDKDRRNMNKETRELLKLVCVGLGGLRDASAMALLAIAAVGVVVAVLGLTIFAV